MKYLLILLSATSSWAIPSPAVSPYEMTLARHAQAKKSGTTRFSIDINGDDQRDIFASALGDSAIEGRTYSLFLKNKTTYQAAGEIFINPKAFQLLSTKHGDVPDILTYRIQSESNGQLEEYHFNGKRYAKASVKKIKSADLEKYLKTEHVMQINSAAGRNW